MCSWALGGENQVGVQTAGVCLSAYVQFCNISESFREHCHENTCICGCTETPDRGILLYRHPEKTNARTLIRIPTLQGCTSLPSPFQEKVLVQGTPVNARPGKAGWPLEVWQRGMQHEVGGASSLRQTMNWLGIGAAPCGSWLFSLLPGTAACRNERSSCWQQQRWKA